jgi:GntR family transcriptional regulator / MocR family aminotransferase
MDLHLTLDGQGSLRERLERELRDAIRGGRLPPGTRLPATRELARELGVSRGVVVEAYGQLVAEGRLVGRRGGGTRVADAAAPQADAAPRRITTRSRVRYDLRTGVPDAASFPRSAWRAATLRTLQGLPDAALAYGNPRGALRLRTALAAYLGRARAVRTEPDRIVPSLGVTDGIRLVGLALAGRGVRRVAVEDPGWRNHRTSLELAGIEPVAVPVDEDGINAGALERAQVGAVVLAPAHQYPTGAVLAPARRAAIVAWARRAGAVIIEDDYDAEFRYDAEPVAALQGLDPDGVVYAGTASKTIAPALRLGWLVLPAGLVEPVLAEQARAGTWPPALLQATLADLVARGEWDRHVRRVRLRYRARRDALANALRDELPDARIGGAAAGLHLTLWLPEDADEELIARRAAGLGVRLHTLHGSCSVDADVPPALLLGYAAVPEPALVQAARLVAQAVTA